MINFGNLNQYRHEDYQLTKQRYVAANYRPWAKRKVNQRYVNNQKSVKSAKKTTFTLSYTCTAKGRTPRRALGWLILELVIRGWSCIQQLIHIKPANVATILVHKQLEHAVELPSRMPEVRDTHSAVTTLFSYPLPD